MSRGCRRIWQVVLFVLPVCASVLGCAAGVRTAIHESASHDVFLEWVPDESFHASHPAAVSPTTLHRVLTGLYVQSHKGLFDRLSGQEQGPDRVLSHEDVELLLPHLVSALSRATPEERVVFQRVYAYDLGSHSTAGILYVRGDLIFVTLTRYAASPGRPDIRYVDNRQAPATSGLADRTLLFVPRDAWQPEQSRPQAATPTMAINYAVLESLPEPVEKASAGSRSRETGGVPEAPPGDAGLHGLKEQVNQQEKELEQLKRELRDLQRDRGE